MKRLLRRFAAPIFGALFLVGCSVGPQYVGPPKTPTPEAWVGQVEAVVAPVGAEAAAGRADAQAVAGGAEIGIDQLGPAPDSAWWASLEDPLLVELIERAINANYDLQIATARVREARASRSIATGDLYPELNAGVGATRSRASENGLGVAQLADAGLVDIRNDLFQTGFDAIWELDVFGGKRRRAESATARLGGAIEARRDVLLTVIAEVARNYVELRGAQRRLDVAQRNIEIQSESLQLVENKFRVGLSPELDVARSTALLAASRSRLPHLRTLIRAATYRLSVLLGEPPGALLGDLLEHRPIPASPVEVPLGLPSELLRRRSDLRRAERELHAATADIGVATAELFPKFALTGGAGLQSTEVGSLLAGASHFWFLGGLIRWPIFQGGKIRASIRAVEARHEVALARYRLLVLSALEDVEVALVAFREKQLERAQLAESARASARATELARVLYDIGLSEYLDVLDAERTLLEVEDRLAASETEVVTRLIALYKALGGGWREFEPAVVAHNSNRGVER